MSRVRNDRGSVLVELPFAICILLVLAMGLTTIVQIAWTHLALSSAVQVTTRYSSHVDYDPASGGIDRRRTAAQVQAWAAEVAAEAHVDPDDVTVSGRHLPSGVVVPIEQLVAGDEITVTVTKTVSNPLYRLAASITNTASHVVGAGDVFDPDGVGVRAEAVTFVE